MKRCFSNVGGVRIVDVRTVLLTGPCTHDPWLSVFKQSRSAAFVEIETDAGIVGLGETYAGYFFPESVPLVVDYLRPVLLAVDGVDRDDFDLRVVVARMRTCFQYWGRVGLGAAVLAGIEGALWDLVGKVRGLPVHRLLAPEAFDAPDSLPAYATGGPSPWPTDDLLRKVEFYLGLGFRAVKLQLRLPRLGHPRRGAHQRRPGGRRDRGREGDPRPRHLRPRRGTPPRRAHGPPRGTPALGRGDGGRRPSRPRTVRPHLLRGAAALRRPRRLRGADPEHDDPRRGRRAALDGRRVRRLRGPGRLRRRPAGRRVARHRRVRPGGAPVRRATDARSLRTRGPAASA